MEKIRMLISRDDFYHQRGYWVVAKTLSEAGIEVILGGIQTPSEMVQTAIHEDVDIIGCRIMDASPPILIKILFEEMKKNDIEHIPVVVGGIVSEKDEISIKEMGVKEIFRPYDSLQKLKEGIKAIGMEVLRKAKAS